MGQGKAEDPHSDYIKLYDRVALSGPCGAPGVISKTNNIPRNEYITFCDRVGPLDTCEIQGGVQTCGFWNERARYYSYYVILALQRWCAFLVGREYSVIRSCEIQGGVRSSGFWNQNEADMKKRLL